MLGIPMLAGAGDPAGLVTAITFLAAIMMLDLFDISLPRGDSVSVSGALVASGIVLMGSAVGAAVALGSALVAELLKRRDDQSAIHRPSAGAGRVCGLLAALAPVLAMGHAARPLLAALSCAAYLLGELIMSQVIMSWRSRRKLSRLIRGNLRRQLPLLAAQVSTSSLTVITFAGMREWSLIPVGALLLLMRQSYAMLLDVRETYRTTVEVLVEVAEESDSRRCGHAERTSAIARDIAMKAGLTAPQVERISFAALLHDIDAISGCDATVARVGRSAQVCAGAKFFDDLQPILRICDGSGAPDHLSESDLVAAMAVALASDIDSRSHPQVGEAHSFRAVERVSDQVSATAKAAIVGAALELGYSIPAVT